MCWMNQPLTLGQINDHSDQSLRSPDANAKGGWGRLEKIPKGPGDGGERDQARKEIRSSGEKPAEQEVRAGEREPVEETIEEIGACTAPRCQSREEERERKRETEKRWGRGREIDERDPP